MAATRAKNPVGSTEWINSEKENVAQLVQQEMEEVEFPVRHEMEWLNEHMADIFAGDQFNVTELFKTPGKLRGKTPRTARKYDTPRETRVPLSDIFSSAHNVKNTPAPANRFNQEIAKLADNNEKQSPPPPTKRNSNPNYNADSGYHGMPDEDTMEIDPYEELGETETATQPHEEATIVAPDHEDRDTTVARRMTEDSFHSAREVAPSKENTVEPMDFEYSRHVQKHSQPPEEPLYPTIQSSSKPEVHARSKSPVEKETPLSPEPMILEDSEHSDDHDFDDIGSPSDGSTPARPLIRKSSLTFASLPAREPLMKRSMGGARMSRTSHIDPSKSNMGIGGQTGYFKRQTGGTRPTQTLSDEKNKQVLDASGKGGNDTRVAVHEDSDTDVNVSKFQNKSSTQLLHEKINMLGKSQTTRTTKSIAPMSLASQQVGYPDLPVPNAEPTTETLQKPSAREPPSNMESWDKLSKSPSTSQREPLVNDRTTGMADKPNIESQVKGDNDNQGARPRAISNGSPERQSPAPKPSNLVGAFHKKSASTASVLASPRPGTPAGSPLKSAGGENKFPASTTPTSSPKRYDGHLSASKSKLQSIMKTAKGLFTNSAGASTAAKLESVSPDSQRSHPGVQSNGTGVLGQNVSQSPAPNIPSKPEGRRTRSSIEREARRREKELKDRQRMKEQLEQAREQDKQKAPQSEAPQNLPVLQKLDKVVVPAPPPAIKNSPHKVDQPAKPPARRGPEREEEPKFAVPAVPQQQPKQNESRRPVKPVRETQKPKPQPVNIKIGTLSQRMRAESNAPAPSTVQEPAPTPPVASKQATVTKKGSNSSVQTMTSNNSLKSSTSSASSKSKAMLAVERKKEQDRREAQRKLEQRREAERKKVAQQEEARRQEQHNRAEAERREREREREQSVVDDPKKAAKKQAIEKRRLENARRLEQQRNQQPTPSSDTGSILQQEKHGLIESQRSDMGPPRAPSRLNSAQPLNRHQPPTNTVKPSKRANEAQNASRPAVTRPGVTHQPDGKRRKTDEEIAVEQPMRHAMAPPIRQSNVRKDAPKLQPQPQQLQQPQLFHNTNKYPAAAPQASYSQGGPSIFNKNPAGSQRQLQGNLQPANPYRNAHPLEMAQYTNGKIPFAESSNPPHAPPPPSNNSYHKTPGKSQKQAQKYAPQIKSSPAQPNGENIKLPEIPTDSEDEDSDAEPYNVPDWAKQDNLHKLLYNQEGQDARSVFGPSAPVRMDEIFKEGKDRLKKFRNRTSSANWNGPDGLTQDEIKWDMSEREKLKANGGWMGV